MNDPKLNTYVAGNKGIGKALCQKLLAAYADTYVILGARDTARGQDAVSSIVQTLGEDVRSRIEFLPLDVTDDTSVNHAATAMLAKFGPSSFYAIVNNAAVGFGSSLSSTLQTNLFGPRRVTEAFLSLLCASVEPLETARIVNISSASGPMFITKMRDSGVPVEIFTDPATTWADLKTCIDNIENSVPGVEKDAYGLSKACLNMYTIQLAQTYPQYKINSCTPGFIDTDLTKGFGATNTPEMGTVSALHCLFSPDAGTGRYYGSDAVRSPIDRYRAPGDAPYEP